LKSPDEKTGTDVGCINVPRTKVISVTVDSFDILGGVAFDVLKAEKNVATTVADPTVNAEFAFKRARGRSVQTCRPTSRRPQHTDDQRPQGARR